MLPKLGLPVLVGLLAGCPGVQLDSAALLQLVSLVSERQLGDDHPLNLNILKRGVFLGLCICVVQMAKNLVHSFYYILYQP